MMLFKRRGKTSAGALSESGGSAADALGYRVEFDMMLKGNVYKRPSGQVRQYGVTVRGSTRLVTSGDWVDRDTYEALIEAGAIRPDPAVTTRIAERKKRALGEQESDAGKARRR